MNSPTPDAVPSGERPVAEVMSTVLYAVAEDEGVLVAWEYLERSGRHHLPVVGADGRCVQLLDRADLAVACAAPATALSGTTVGDLPQNRRPAMVRPGDSLHRAAAVLGLAGVDALVVTGERGRLVGLVTAGDLVAAFAGRRPARRTAASGRQEEPHLLLPGLPPRRPERRTGVP